MNILFTATTSLSSFDFVNECQSSVSLANGKQKNIKLANLTGFINHSKQELVHYLLINIIIFVV